jgi:CRP-like cAMP-binding protein
MEIILNNPIDCHILKRVYTEGGTVLNKVKDVTYQQHPPASELRTLFSSGRRLSYKKGEIIQHANEIPQGIYFLFEGFVREFTLSNDGEQHLTLVYEPGEIFSVNWMFLGILPNVYRQAHTDVIVHRVSEKEFKDAIKANPDLHSELTYLMMKQVHLLSSRVENLTFSNAYDKVAYHLIHLAGRFGELTDEGWYIRLPFRHQQIAEALSMSRETASRMIARMEKKGLIRQNGKGHFILRNPSALAGTIGVDEVLGMWPQLAQNPSDKDHS